MEDDFGQEDENMPLGDDKLDHVRRSRKLHQRPPWLNRLLAFRDQSEQDASVQPRAEADRILSDALREYVFECLSRFDDIMASTEHGRVPEWFKFEFSDTIEQEYLKSLVLDWRETEKERLHHFANAAELVRTESRYISDDVFWSCCTSVAAIEEALRETIALWTAT